MRFFSFLLPGLLMTGGFDFMGCRVSKGGGGFDFVIMMRIKKIIFLKCYVRNILIKNYINLQL